MKKRWPPVRPRYRILALIANRYPASLAGQEQAPHGDTLRGRRAAKLGDSMPERLELDKPARYEASGRSAVPHLMLYSPHFNRKQS
jgi:hypothetical protein